MISSNAAAEPIAAESLLLLQSPSAVTCELSYLGAGIKENTRTNTHKHANTHTGTSTYTHTRTHTATIRPSPYIRSLIDSGCMKRRTSWGALGKCDHAYDVSWGALGECDHFFDVLGCLGGVGSRSESGPNAYELPSEILRKSIPKPVEHPPFGGGPGGFRRGPGGSWGV